MLLGLTTGISTTIAIQAFLTGASASIALLTGMKVRKSKW